MAADLRLSRWPEPLAAAVFRCGDDFELLAHQGPMDEMGEWASVSKLAVAWLAHHRGSDLTSPLGPESSTLAHVLSHCSGLGSSADALGARVGTKRIYSTYGYELALNFLSDERGPTFLVSTMNSMLGTSVESDGTAAGGLRGSLRDLLMLANEWVVLSRSASEWVVPFLPEIGGIVPGFGPFTPNPWGLGPELKGDKQHWMGRHWSAESLGHFGQSGSLLLIDPIAHIGVVALSRIPFGAWAVPLFGEWTDEVWEMWR